MSLLNKLFGEARKPGPLEKARYQRGLDSYGRYSQKLSCLPPESASWDADARRTWMMNAWGKSFAGLDPNDLLLPAKETARYVHTHFFKTQGKADLAHPAWVAIEEAYSDLIVTGVCIAFAQIDQPMATTIDRHCDAIHALVTSGDDKSADFACAISAVDPIQSAAFAQRFPQLMVNVGRPSLPPDHEQMRLLTMTLRVRLPVHGYLGALMANGKA